MKKYLTTAVSISVLFFLLCAIKGIFPFGTATIDTVDFASQWVPGYYHVWDVLHGNASLFFDWRVAGGMDLTGASSQFSLLSPYNLLLIFIDRGQIQQFMTFFIWVKVMAMGLSMCFFLQKMAEKRAYAIAGWNVVWLTAGSVSYALSAYTFAYYGMGWIDIASILPILIYNLMQMLTEEQDWKPGKHAIGYTFCLFLIFCVNIPQAYMICFFLILFAGGYVFLLRGGMKKTAAGWKLKIDRGGILKFGLTTLLALGGSAAIFLPAARNMLSSSRLSGAEYTGENSYFWLLSQNGMDPQVKWRMLLGVCIPFLYLIVTTRKRKEHVFQTYLIFLMIVPVAVEAVNLMWHRGTYMCFPMRHGYMMIFAILYVAWERYLERQERRSESRWTPRVKKAASGVILAAWTALTLALGVVIMSTNVHGNDVDLVRDAEELEQLLGGDSDDFHKVKIADASLDSNYPLIANVSSYSNYLHLMTEGQIKMQQALGYSQTWTRISDTGGTLFSDALLGYAYQVRNKNTSEPSGMEQYYEPYGETDHFIVSRSKYQYGAGLRMELDAYRQLDQNVSGYVFENQNRLSQALFGTEFFTTWTETFIDEKANETLHYEIEVPKEGVLYLYSKELSGATIRVNGETLLIPSYTNLQGTTYLTEYNNGILTLGSFSGETVEVELDQTCYDTGIPKEIQFAILDMQSFTDSVRKNAAGENNISYSFGEKCLEITATAPEEQFIMLPVNTDGGWKVTINGNEEGYTGIYGNLMLVQLKPGQNQIHLEAVPRGMKRGILVTAAAGVAALLWLWLGRIKAADKVCRPLYEVISYVAGGIFFLIFVGFLLVVYVIPVGYSLWLKF